MSRVRLSARGPWRAHHPTTTSEADGAAPLSSSAFPCWADCHGRRVHLRASESEGTRELRPRRTAPRRPRSPDSTTRRRVRGGRLLSAPGSQSRQSPGESREGAWKALALRRRVAAEKEAPAADARSRRATATVAHGSRLPFPSTPGETYDITKRTDWPPTKGRKAYLTGCSLIRAKRRSS